jgi:hypothetical protein
MAECNQRLIKEVADELKSHPSIVAGCIDFYGEFIANTIRAGAMEGVIIPYLGKIQVKLINQQYKDFLHAQTPAFKKMVKDASGRQLDELFKFNDE